MTNGAIGPHSQTASAHILDGQHSKSAEQRGDDRADEKREVVRPGVTDSEQRCRQYGHEQLRKLIRQGDHGSPVPASAVDGSTSVIMAMSTATNAPWPIPAMAIPAAKVVRSWANRLTSRPAAVNNVEDHTIALRLPVRSEIQLNTNVVTTLPAK
jgi:hypothetical protein